MSSYIAGKMMEKKVSGIRDSLNGMLAPLLDSDDESLASSRGSDDSSTSTVSVVKQTPTQKLKSLAVYLGVGAGVAAAGASMVLAPAIAIFVMGGICIANAPYSVFKEKQMAKLPSLRSMNNKLREDANDLADNVDALAAEIDELEPEADRAVALEENLREIAVKQKFNVDKLVDLVKENEAIQAQMRDNLRQVIVQDMIRIVVMSDSDGSGTFNKSEAKNLALRIRLAMQQHNVVFDHVKFLKVVGNDATVQGVIGIVQKLLPEPKKRDEEGDESDGDTDEDWDSDESWDSDDEEDDIYDMFHIPDDHPCMRQTSFAGADSAGGAASGSGEGGATPRLNRSNSLMKSQKRRSSKKLKGSRQQSLITPSRRGGKKVRGKAARGTVTSV